MHLREEKRFRGDLGICSDPLSIYADKAGMVSLEPVIPDAGRDGSARHVPVLADELVGCLAGRGPLVDATVGAGGHLRALLAHLPAGVPVLALDRDGDMMRATRSEIGDPRVSWTHGRFGDLDRHVAAWGHTPHAVVADLGVSSWQLDRADRGFSLQREGPLDMRMDRTQSLTAAQLLREIDEKTLREALRDEADEPRAARIAREIKSAASAGKLDTTLQLVRCVESVTGPSAGRHPATRTFQALRRLVNAEGRELDEFLSRTPGLLAPGGRLAVISFHSGEDRVVKNAFAACERSGGWKRLNRKPAEASAEECRRNPRARSARLRVLERTA